MRSAKSKKTLKSLSDLKTLLDNCSFPPAAPAADDGKPELQKPSPESDHQLFCSAMSDVIPLPRRNRIQKPENAPPPKAPQGSPDRDVLTRLKNLIRYGDGFLVSDTPEYIGGTGYRVPDLIVQRLHQGDFSIQSSIDLHGLGLAAAKETFEAFMTDAVQKGERAVLVIHGRGLSSSAEPVLKTQIYNWLTRSRWRNWIIAFSSARLCDGGAGATYILLRQHPLTKRSRRKFNSGQRDNNSNR